MIVVKYNGAGDFRDLNRGQEYKVLAVSIPVRDSVFVRVVDASEEDYLYQLECFDVIEGRDSCLADALSIRVAANVSFDILGN